MVVGGGKRRAWLAVMLVAAGMLAVTAALAYACTVQPTMSLRDGSASSGGTVDGTGEFFSKTGGPVQLHFNSLDSAVVWSGPADAVGRIAFRFEVPDVAPGDYTIVATQVSVTGQPVAGTPSRAPLTVVASQAPAGVPAPGAPRRPAPRAAPQPDRSPAVPRTRRPSPARAPAARAPAPRGDGPAASPDRAGSGGAEPGDAVGTTSEPAATGRGGASAPAVERGRGSAGSAGQGASAPERSAGGDLWSGFASAKGSSLTAGDNPPAAAGGRGLGLAVAVGMLGIGLVGLLGGVLVATMRRRRRAVEQRARPQAPRH